MNSFERLMDKSVDMMDTSLKMVYLYYFLEIVFAIAVIALIIYAIRAFIGRKEDQNGNYDFALFDIVDKREKETPKENKQISNIEFYYNQLSENDKRDILNLIKKRIYEETLKNK